MMMHRLNRTEYLNSVQDLFHADLSPRDTSLLPPDDTSFGFDNNGDILGLSPLLLERYLSVAERVTTAALGPTSGVEPDVYTHHVDFTVPQRQWIEGLPLGTKFSEHGDSILVIAILNSNYDVADFLLNKGADPNAGGTHWAPLHALIRVRNYEETQFPAPKGAGKLDSLEFAKHLLAHGANPSARADGYTTKRSSGDQNYEEFKGATPLFLAAKAADLPMIHLLQDAKADYTTPIYTHTNPLMVAAGIGCVTGQWIEPEHDVLETVRLLVETLGADVNATNDRNENAVHGAACRAMDSVVQYLADKGARLDVKNADGMTPLDLVVDGVAKPVEISGVPIEKIGYSDHTAALLRKLLADARYSKTSALH